MSKHRCPVIAVGDNGTQEKVSAYWSIGAGGLGKCARHRRGRCELSGASCPLGGKKQFEMSYRWENIFKEKYYLGGIR